MSSEKYSWLWDVDMDSARFQRTLAGQERDGFFDQAWALVRLIDYAPYPDILRLMPRQAFVTLWPQIESHIRSATRREGMAFVREQLLARSKAA
jgi:hypothetical protein